MSNRSSCQAQNCIHYYSQEVPGVGSVAVRSAPFHDSSLRNIPRLFTRQKYALNTTAQTLGLMLTS
ncbi:hypothetical protein IG631_14910 [Alternaria alternata]|nr:hypothetical protein IG631_14910 [Alternaria alternata]